MSVPKLISPLLDGYVMGEALNAHHGVYCCPALLGDSEERYIVKVISIPASQDQLDALLLTGAFQNELRALDYFKELAEGVCGEVKTLEQLSKLDGFVPYLGCQSEKMDDGVGYDVYLLAPYRPSLEKSLHTQPLTHLAAVNLGLDMCAALSVCRKAGYLYADLKPDNIYLTEMRGYCIGDLGFIPLQSLKYASLPDKYRSSYTPPEITDAYAPLSDTMDIYALGLVLYQVYNNGELPFTGSAPAQPLPSPMYADYEMAEIILKACAPDPADRWKDPAQMGQALVDYMQRNSINDTSIVPPPPEPPISEESEVAEFLTDEENDQELAELLALIPDEEPPQPEDAEVPSEDAPQENAEEASDQENEEEISEDAPQEDDKELSEEVPPDELSSEDPVCEDGDAPEEKAEAPASDDEADSAEPASHPKTEVTEDGVTEEVAGILEQADALAQIDVPDPVVVPDPIDIPIPPPIVIEPEEDPEEETAADEEEPSQDSTEDEEEYELPDVPFPEEIQRKRKRHWLSVGIALIMLVLLALGAHFFYQGYYLQSIDSLTVQGGKDSLTVSVVTGVDESLLTAVCTDTYGNTLRQGITNGTAYFPDLKPNTQYKIQMQIQGFHKLTGNTVASYTTASQTQIVSFNAAIGQEDGSVQLSFVSDGPDSDRWLVEYTTEDGVSQTASFTDKAVTLYGLSVDQEYTFRIVSQDDLFITGNYEITYTPKALIYAENLQIESYADGELTVSWLSEADSDFIWVVSCRSDSGFNQTVTTTDFTATFGGLDMDVGYTVTVTAEGMSQGESIVASPQPITVTEYSVQSQQPWSILLNWSFTGQTPSGWIVAWKMDGVPQEELLCQENQATIPVRPGYTYTFEARPADAITYFTQSYTYGPTEIPEFEGYGVVAEDFTVTTHRTPGAEVWDAGDLGSDTQSAEFTVEESACLLMELSASYGVTDDSIATTFVIFDSDGRLVSTESVTRTWDEMWHKRKCAVQLPQMPATPGNYALDLYIADQFVATVEFSIV